MKKNIFSLLFLLFILNDVFGQKVIFRENFRNNKNNWGLHNDKNFSVKIKKGKLYVQKFERNQISNGCLWYQHEIPGFNSDQNFSIIFYAKIVSIDDLFNAIDFQWGRLSDSDSSIYKKFNLYQVIINPLRINLANFNGQWTYFDRFNTGDLSLVASLHKKNRFNKYEIEQKDGVVLLRLNNTLVYQRNVPAIGGGEIGIQQCVKSSWQINKIIIKQG